MAFKCFLKYCILDIQDTNIDIHIGKRKKSYVGGTIGAPDGKDDQGSSGWLRISSNLRCSINYLLIEMLSKRRGSVNNIASSNLTTIGHYGVE